MNRCCTNYNCDKTQKCKLFIGHYDAYKVKEVFVGSSYNCKEFKEK